MAQTGEVQQQLLQAEQRRQQAMIAADLAALEDLLDNDLVHVHSTGMVHNKPQLLAHIHRMGGFIDIERDEPAIRLAGEYAILTGLTRNTVRSLETGATIVREGFATLVWRYTETGWRVLLSQLTPLTS
ncbi:TPA: nuclear transport factor 2 family protein [Klebsiella pneumoniae]|nr:nuclear transport factor 2 family protein [Klebsiella pneumoniae]